MGVKGSQDYRTYSASLVLQLSRSLVPIDHSQVDISLISKYPVFPTSGSCSLFPLTFIGAPTVYPCSTVSQMPFHSALHIELYNVNLIFQTKQ